MAQAAVSTEAVNDPQTVRSAPTDYDRSTALSKVAAFIPTEAVAVYLALVAFFNPDGDVMRWVVFGIGVVLVPVFYFLAYMNRRRAVGADGGAPEPSLRVTLLLLVFALLAFVAWAAAMPNNPFEQFTDEATKFGGGAIIVLGVLMPQAAGALGLTKQ
ncbi:hypothetical protein [Actinocorallia longicatena]|uniref:Uncharacterized protein n=1 Tax=Actinocorallia longicatena TaxID=111803 RepID=A0ABP6QCS9_9ACTN